MLGRRVSGTHIPWPIVFGLAMDLGTLFDLYGRYRTPRKSAREQRADARRIAMWTRFLGRAKDPAEVTLREWEGFQDARRAGAMDARLRTVTDPEPYASGFLSPFPLLGSIMEPFRNRTRIMNITLKNIPESLYRRLKQMAARNRRSLNSEVIHRLERSIGAVPVEPGNLLARARVLRERANVEYLTDEALRAARDDGRA